MQVKVRSQMRFKGPEMEGVVARWYAKLRRSETQIEEYRKQAAQLTEGLAPGAKVLEVAPGPGYLAIEMARLGGVQVTSCPDKGQSTGGCESRPRKPPEEREANSPASGETRRRSEGCSCRPQRVNSVASKEPPVRDRAGRTQRNEVKAAVRAMDSGAARNRSGVLRRHAAKAGWSTGEALPHPTARSTAAEAWPGIRLKPKAGAVRRESERGIIPRIVETTELGVGKAPHFGDARVARDGRGHGFGQPPH